MAAEPAADVEHQGGCHCGAVRFSFLAPARIVAWDCNCSICAMKRNTHFMVPKPKLTLTKGQEPGAMTTYTFGTHTAQHLFCSTCGVVAFYQPRSNPDCWGVTVHCVDPGTLEDVEVRTFDGENWEDSYAATGIEAAGSWSGSGSS